VSANRVSSSAPDVRPPVIITSNINIDTDSPAAIVGTSAGQTAHLRNELEVFEMERLLLNASQTAEMLGIGRSTVYELAAKGLIPSLHVGARLRFPRDRLLRWIETRLENDQNGSEVKASRTAR
jgi:excisionase family DNA binding protein